MRYITLIITLLLATPAGSHLRADHHLPTHSAVTPAPREGGWMNRHNRFNEIVQENQGQIDLAFIGDSITQGWEGAGKAVWAAYYGERKALNLGIGGDRTQHVLWRLDNGNLDGISPKIAVIMIGTNNSANDRNSASEIVDGVTAIVTKLRQQTPSTKLLLLAIFPRGADFNEQRGKILQVNQTLSRLHDGESVFYQDIGQHFIEDNGSISPSIMPDSLHLSTAGYGIWAEAIEPFLAKHLGDTPVSVEHASFEGEWGFEMESPQGVVESTLKLTENGPKLSGEIVFTPERVIPIKAGGRFQDQFQLRIVRDRPQGGTMSYNITGTLKNDRITGEAVARMDGERVTIPWSATRR